ncbi:unnamed protein product, partial [Musa acuminata subsp. burmannicoides]
NIKFIPVEKRQKFITNGYSKTVNSSNLWFYLQKKDQSFPVYHIHNKYFLIRRKHKPSLCSRLDFMKIELPEVTFRPSASRALGLHDAFYPRGVERVHHRLPLCDLELGLPVGESRNDGGGIGETPVVTEPIDRTPLRVLPYVVVGELRRRAEERAEQREHLRSRSRRS